MSSIQTDWDVVIIGAGPAGCAAAYHLARRGRRVVVLERDAMPTEKVCGELLRAEAIPLLQAMDIDVTALGAPRITIAHVLAGRTNAAIPLPAPAYGLSRATLDAACATQAIAAGAVLYRGVTVRGWSHEADTHLVTTNHDTYRSRAVILATGKHDLRAVQVRASRTPQFLRHCCAPRQSRGLLSRRHDNAIGIKWHCQANAAARVILGDAVWMLAFPGGYAGLCRVDRDLVNCCASVTTTWLARHDHRPERLWDFLDERFPAVRPLFAGLSSTHARPLVIAGIPYGFFRRARPTDAHAIYAVGDQCATMPSVVGIGMTVALATGTLAAADCDAVLNGQPRHYESEARRLLTTPRRSALLTHALATTPLAPFVARCLQSFPRAATPLLQWSALRVPDHGKKMFATSWPPHR